MIGNPEGARSLAILSVVEETPSAVRICADLAAAMPVQVVHASDRSRAFSPDPDALPWEARTEPAWMPAPGTLRGRHPCWHKAEVAFLLAWRRLRSSVSPELKWVWCTEHDVLCTDWRHLEETAAGSAHDLLGVNIRLRPARGVRAGTGTMLLTCFRASVRLMDWLVAHAPENRNVFCERAVASSVDASGYTWSDFKSVAGLHDLYSPTTVRPRPPVTPSPADRCRLWHPVKSLDGAATL